MPRVVYALVIGLLGGVGCDPASPCTTVEMLSWHELDDRMADTHYRGIAASLAALSGDYCVELATAEDNQTSFLRTSVRVVPLVNQPVQVAYRGEAFCSPPGLPVRVFMRFEPNSGFFYPGPVFPDPSGSYLGPDEARLAQLSPLRLDLVVRSDTGLSYPVSLPSTDLARWRFGPVGPDGECPRAAATGRGTEVGATDGGLQ